MLDNQGERDVMAGGGKGVSGSAPNTLEAWRSRLRKQAGAPSRWVAEGVARSCHEVRLGCFTQSQDTLQIDPRLLSVTPEGNSYLATCPSAAIGVQEIKCLAVLVSVPRAWSLSSPSHTQEGSLSIQLAAE